MIRFLGYFPGYDPTDEEQFGRRVHVRKLIERFSDLDDVDAGFVVGVDAGDLPETVCETGPEPKLIDRVRGELRRSYKIAREAYVADEPLAVYSRESPYFAPLVATVIPNARLISEANDVPEDVRSGVSSWRQFLVLRTVRQLKWRLADHVVAVSDPVAIYLSEECGVDAVTVVKNGVDTDQFTLDRSVSREPPYELCYVGGFQSHQNIDLMLQTVAKLETPVRFRLVGGSPKERGRLSERVSRLGLSNVIEFTGTVPHDEIPLQLHSADLCFGPFSSERQASPLKIYEYLACGREVVLVNDSGMEGFDEYPGVHRLATAPAATLAERIDGILGTVDVNERGAEVVRNNRSWRAVVKQIVEIAIAVSRTS